VRFLTRLLALEARTVTVVGSSLVHGTILQRVQMDTELAIREDPRMKPLKKSTLMWCLALGGLSQPGKLFFYSSTPQGCILKAESALDEIEKSGW